MSSQSVQHRPRLNPIPRVGSGIPGLDELLEGGFPKDRCVVVAGPPGVGKTILGLQYIHRGVEDYGEPGVLITLDESVSSLLQVAYTFDWDMDKYVYEKKLSLFQIAATNFADLNVELKKQIREYRPKRIVIDPISTLVLQVQSPYVAKREIGRLFEELRKANTTTVITSEHPDGKFTPELYLADGVFFLTQLGDGAQLSNGPNVLQITKMRLTKIDHQYHPYCISSEGFVVNPKIWFRP